MGRPRKLPVASALAESSLPEMANTSSMYEVQITSLKEKLEEALAEVAALKLVNTALTKQVAAAPQENLPFDPSKRYRLKENFAGIIGQGHRVDYEAGAFITDPYVLEHIHKAGAKLIRDDV